MSLVSPHNSHCPEMMGLVYCIYPDDRVIIANISVTGRRLRISHLYAADSLRYCKHHGRGLVSGHTTASKLFSPHPAFIASANSCIVIVRTQSSEVAASGAIC